MSGYTTPNPDSHSTTTAVPNSGIDVEKCAQNPGDTRDTPTPHPSPTPPSPPSEREAKLYYAGLPSCPPLVARTGTTPWKEPTGPEAYPRLRDLRVVGNHALQDVWEHPLAPELHTLLDSINVEWTSTDVVRIGYVGEPSAPIILWIGVKPSSLSGAVGVDVALECHNLLGKHNITDVDVEIRESVVTRLVGLDPPKKLLKPAYYTDPIATICNPFTTTLSLPICAESMRESGGTGGFFMTDSGRPGKLFLVTARHVLFQDNKYFKHKDNSHLRRNVILFKDEWFEKHCKSIKNAIILKEDTIRGLKGHVGSGDILETEDSVRSDQVTVEVAAKKQLEILSEYVSRWEKSSNRILGHVFLSPPLHGAQYKYTEDWAVIEIDASQVDANNFHGNVIDLGTGISSEKFLEIMRSDTNDPNSIKYPPDRLLRLNDIIRTQDLGNYCFNVIKHGSASGLTFGISNNIHSYTHDDFGEMARPRKEWCILPYDKFKAFPTSPPFPHPSKYLHFFSDYGDSGSVIVDGRGRIGGLLTGGSIHKVNESPVDVTYATPIEFLLGRMRARGLQPDLSTPHFAKQGPSSD